MARILILRHAPSLTPERLAGRLDVNADCSDAGRLAAMRARIGTVDAVVSSPARRCLQTARAMDLCPDRVCADLWEQDFGAWEGLPHAELPDLGPLASADLANSRPPGGESFDDMAARARPVLNGLDRDTLVIGHAGTVRAALSLVAGTSALCFHVAPLSLTVLHHAAGQWSVEAVNVTA